MTNILRNNVSQFVPGSEAAEAFRISGGALAKRITFVYDQNQTILCRSQTERKFLKIYNLHNVGNGLYRVFTNAKRALSFLQKRAFIQEILFSFCKWGTLAPQKGTFFIFKKSGGGQMPPLHSRFRGPCPGFKGYLYKLLGIFI
jgi:hypothetical protein